MTTRQLIRKMCILLTLAVAVIYDGKCAAVDCPYFPLDEGWTWEYTGDGNDHASTWVEGTQQVQGIETIILHWQFAGELHDYLEQYYTVDAEGNVYIHGFNAVTAGLIRSFDPPILYLPAFLAPSAEWCTTVQDYEDLEGIVPVGDPFEICFTVESVEQLTVPAGTFLAYGIGQFTPILLESRSGTRDMLGRCLDASGREASDWFAEEVGEIALDIYQYFHLSSWTEPPTPVESKTWGGIKGAFLQPREGAATGATRE